MFELEVKDTTGRSFLFELGAGNGSYHFDSLVRNPFSAQMVLQQFNDQAIEKIYHHFYQSDAEFFLQHAQKNTAQSIQPLVSNRREILASSLGNAEMLLWPANKQQNQVDAASVHRGELRLKIRLALAQALALPLNRQSTQPNKKAVAPLGLMVWLGQNRAVHNTVSRAFAKHRSLAVTDLRKADSASNHHTFSARHSLLTGENEALVKGIGFQSKCISKDALAEAMDTTLIAWSHPGLRDNLKLFTRQYAEMYTSLGVEKIDNAALEVALSMVLAHFSGSMAALQNPLEAAATYTKFSDIGEHLVRYRSLQKKVKPATSAGNERSYQQLLTDEPVNISRSSRPPAAKKRVKPSKALPSAANDDKQVLALIAAAEVGNAFCEQCAAKNQKAA